MRVTIYGPNVNFADGATLHVHRADCHDLTRAPYSRIRPGGDQGGYTEDHTSKRGIVESIYDPDCFDYDPDSDDERAPYDADVHIFPCVTLPDADPLELGAPTLRSDVARNRRGETREEAWARYHADHPEVLASWAEQNGRFPEPDDDPTRAVS